LVQKIKQEHARDLDYEDYCAAHLVRMHSHCSLCFVVIHLHVFLLTHVYYNMLCVSFRSGWLS
jgi:hypothetical protein